MIASNFIQITILESMKRFTILLIFVGLGFWSSAQQADMKRIDYVNKFYLAVKTHKQSKVIKLMDKNYSKEQIKFLGGNKEQFVNELFSGNDIESGEYINLKLVDIENIEIDEIHVLEGGDRKYIFNVKSGELLVRCSLVLHKTGKKYGFIGAVG